MDGRLLDGRELRVQMARYGRPSSPYRRHSRRRRWVYYNRCVLPPPPPPITANSHVLIKLATNSSSCASIYCSSSHLMWILLHWLYYWKTCSLQCRTAVACYPVGCKLLRTPSDKFQSILIVKNCDWSTFIFSQFTPCNYFNKFIFLQVSVSFSSSFSHQEPL